MIPSVASARSRIGVVSRKSGTPEQVLQARHELNAAMILSLITERAKTGGIAAEHAEELKAAIDEAVGLI